MIEWLNSKRHEHKDEGWWVMNDECWWKNLSVTMTARREWADDDDPFFYPVFFNPNGSFYLRDWTPATCSGSSEVQSKRYLAIFLLIETCRGLIEWFDAVARRLTRGIPQNVIDFVIRYKIYVGFYVGHKNWSHETECPWGGRSCGHFALSLLALFFVSGKEVVTGSLLLCMLGL